MLLGPAVHSSCVLDKNPEGGLQYTWCIESDDTDAALLIDASNAFNKLNRVYTINSYRQPAQLFVIGRKETMSAEGTTQGDLLAMGLYALSIQPFITSPQAASIVKHYVGLQMMLK